MKKLKSKPSDMVSVLSVQDEDYGIKHDSGKLRYDLVPVEAHEALAEVFTYGSSKYGDNNWQAVESNRYEAALFRHLNAWRKGEKVDSESGISHLKHALTNVAILLHKEEAAWAKELDDMYEEHKKSQEEDKKNYYSNGNSSDI